MDKAAEGVSIDIYNLEVKVREKLNELHWKTECLAEAQSELSELRRTFFETQTLLEEERRSSKQLELQLRAAVEANKRLEDERAKSQPLHLRLKMSCEAAEIEREVLISQTRAAKLENMEMRAKIQELEANNASGKAITESLSKSLIELRNSVAQVCTAVHSNAEKLEREQEQLRQSVAASRQFGQRVQSILKSSHVERERDKRRIRELEQQVDDLAAREEPLVTAQVSTGGEQTDMGSLHLKINATLHDLRRKLENNSIEDMLSELCNEFRKVDTDV